MAQYNNVYVDEQYSKIVVANLRKDTFLIDGATYNSAYASGDPTGGVVKFYKYAVGNVTSSTPASDFSSTEPTNELIPVYLNNAFRSSKKLYQVTANSISHNYADQVISEQTEDIREGRETTALASLVYGGTASSNTVASTAETIKANILADLTTARKSKAKPDVLVISPDAYGYLATAQVGAGSVFTPETNEELIKNGSLGKFMGMSVFINPDLGNTSLTTVTYRDAEAQTVNLSTVEYVMYDHKFFAVIDNLNYVAIKDSEMFAGSKSNIEINTGFKVMNANAVIVKKTA